MHASRPYACVDWCVDVLKTPSGIDTVIVSNEGAGYIPEGVFLPRTARVLFSDPRLDKAFQARWFARGEPGRHDDRLRGPSAPTQCQRRAVRARGVD